jgi:hypothetical protein
VVFFVSVQAKGSPAAQSKRTGLLDCVRYYKDAMLGRFYAICNCCACCCGAMQAWQPLVREPSRGEPLEIRQLIAQAAITTPEPGTAP